MTREAAVLGTPSYTLFAGRLGAVDRALMRAGTLVRIGSEADLPKIEVRKKLRSSTWPDPSRSVSEITSLIEREAVELCS